MATTPKTVRTYPINSVTKDFTIPFEYLARKFVVVTLIGATRRELILNTEYRFSTATTITTTKAWGPSDNFTLIEIRRLTSATERLVDFADGSILRAYDLNISSVQSLHIAEEARDLTADTIGVNNDGNLDARARKIVNLADGTDDGDAVNLRQQKQWAGSALNQAQAAAASAQASAASAAAALASANASAGSASSSLTYSQNSANSASASQTSRLASETAKTASETARDLSQSWSSKAEDSVVSGGLYSSYHYSRKSAASATASQTSATNSATSATQAAASVTAAQAQADRAKTEADKLANFNGLAAAIDSVSGTTVFWKGTQVSKTGGFQARLGTDSEANFSLTAADGSDPIRLVRTADRLVHLFANASGDGDRMIWGPTGVTVSKTLTVNGALTTSGQTNTGGISTGTLTATGQVYGSSVRADSQVLVQIPAAGDDTANVHLWLRGKDGTERGLIYGDQGKQVHIRANNGNAGEAILINANNVPTLAGLNVAHRSDFQTVMYKSGVPASDSMYGNCQLQLQAQDGGIPALGFHSAGVRAAALWLNTDNNFYIMKNSGVSELLISNASLMGQIAGNMSANVPGSLGFFNVTTGTNLGPNGVIGGGSLKWSSHNSVLNQTVNGSWRCLGYGNNGGSSLWLRYA